MGRLHPPRLNPSSPSPPHLNVSPPLSLLQDLAESREELGRLQGLIERLGSARSGSGSASNPAAALAALAAAARAVGGEA